MEITQEYNIDCVSQKMVIVKGEMGICLKQEVGQFSSFLLGTVHEEYITSIVSYVLESYKEFVHRNIFTIIISMC